MTRPSAHRRGYDRAWQKLRADAIARSPECVDCGSTDQLEGDHVIPLAAGGLSVRGNVAVRCKPCNVRKGNRPPPREVMSVSAEMAKIFEGADR